MSSFQAFWSVGALSGATLASLALQVHVQPVISFSCVGAAIIGTTLFCYPKLQPDPATQKQSALRLPSKRILTVGTLTFLALFSEGSMADWSAVFLKTNLAFSASAAAIGYACFALSMSAGRFLGDWLVTRYGSHQLLRISGLLTSAGLLVGLFSHHWLLTLIGFAITGFGIANMVPILFGAASRDPEMGPGPGLATANTLGYFGFLAGPPLIGFLAQFVGLSLALSVVILFGLIVAGVGKAVYL